MDQPKDENQKIIKLISTKMKQGEIILMLQNILLYNKGLIQEAKLVITSTTLYFVHSNAIKKYFKAVSIDNAILTPFCSELVIYYDPKGDGSSREAVRMESISSVKIIQDIIVAREKYNEMKEKLTITISASKNLQAIANISESTSKSKLFKFLFHKKQDILDLQQRISGQGEILHASSKNFAIEIGQKMYNQIYRNVKLLYINSNETFRFQQQKYDIQEINPNKKIFKPAKSNSTTATPINLRTDLNRYVLLRKIAKLPQQQLNKKLTEHLRTYRNQQYKQQLLYALELQTHFEVYTTFYEDEKTCQQYLMDHEFLSEKDLRSIFFKLNQMIENTHQILYSLSPENIIMGKDGIRISQIFSCLEKRTQVDYLAPEQLTGENFTQDEVQLINLWKIGILIFELAYGNVPFPEQLIANKIVTNSNQLQLNFPTYSLRTQQFQSFIRSILKINPQERGIQQHMRELKDEEKAIDGGWRKNINKSTWLRYR